MNKHNSRGSALALIMVVVTLLSAAGYYEYHRAFEKNTAKAVVNTVTQVEAAKQTSDAVAKANNDANIAQAKLEAAHKDQIQAVAGNVTGAKIALESDPSPSLQSKIAELMVDNALDVTGPATSEQVKKFTTLVKELAEANAQLAAENANLKNVNLTTTKSLDDVKIENEKVKGNLAVAQQVATQAQAEKDDAVKKNTIAVGVAASSAKQIEIVKISLEDRFKAWALGSGLFLIVGGIILFAVLPILAQAFPVLAPVIKSLTNWILGFWHMLAKKAVEEVESLHSATKATLAATQTQLAAEQAAHAATKSFLSTTQANMVAIATAPTPPTTTPNA